MLTAPEGPSRITGTASVRATFICTSFMLNVLRAVTLSAAYHGGLAGAEQYVNDASVLSAISKAMDFWFANVFQNVACLDSGGTDACPCGTPGFWNTNWFSNVDDSHSQASGHLFN